MGGLRSVLSDLSVVLGCFLVLTDDLTDNLRFLNFAQFTK